MDEREISLDQVLAYLGAEYILRKELEEENQGLQAKVQGLEQTVALMAEQIRDQANSTDRPFGEK